jgi:type II secretory pathway pseudopilin PulG
MSTHTTTTTPAATAWRWTLSIIILVLVVLYARHQYTGWQNEKKATEVRQQAQAAADRLKAQRQQSDKEPINSCTTPCSMYVGWGQRPAWPEQHPINVKFAGMNWIHVPAMGKDVFVFSKEFDMKNFTSGDAQFASPEGLPLVVQVYAN